MSDNREAISKLISSNCLLVVDGQIVVTSKLYEEFGLSPVGIPKDLAKVLWYKFVVDAAIPHRVNGGDGRYYTVRQYNRKAAQYLENLVMNEGIDYGTLVSVTKSYYGSNTYKAVLTNYFEREIWRSEYERSSTLHGSGTNRFED